MSKMMSSAAFGETLQFITTVKLDELEKQRLAYQEHARVVDDARALGVDSLARVERLLGAVRAWPGYSAGEATAGAPDLDSLELWLAQARADPSGVPPALLRRWGDALEAHMRRVGTGFDYARLFGRLFTEWIESGDGAAPAPAEETAEGGAAEEFVEVGRKEMHDQRAQLEALVFEEQTIDTAALEEYLDGLFLAHRDAANTLKDVREDMGKFGKSLMATRWTPATLKTTITSLLSEDLLNNEKSRTLEEFARNESVLEEVASVLNMHLSRIGSWQWTPKEGVAIEMRRALNGKYRFFLDEELLQALFVSQLGTFRCVQRLTRAFYSSTTSERPGKFSSKSSFDDSCTMRGTRPCRIRASLRSSDAKCFLEMSLRTRPSRRPASRSARTNTS